MKSIMIIYIGDDDHHVVVAVRGVLACRITIMMTMVTMLTLFLLLMVIMMTMMMINDYEI